MSTELMKSNSSVVRRSVRPSVASIIIDYQKYQQQRRIMLETLEPMRNEPLTLENLFEWKERPPFMIIAKFIKECMGLRDKYVNT